MKWSVAPLLLLGLAACLGNGASTLSEARAAADASHAAAEADHDYLLFLGITGTEGPLNWTAYEQALEASADPGTSIAQAFDQDVDNGDVGDGLLGSWLTTHFVFDEARHLLGGLYTQYSPEHGLRSVYAPFRGPYHGTLALPGLQAIDLPLRQEDPVLCALTSSTTSWQIDSRQAAAVALARPIMQQHMLEQPDGEVTYYYLPRLGVESGCEASLDVASNHWVVSHADLDAYLEGRTATVAEVRIDAATGEVLAESVRALYIRPPIDIHETLVYQDALVPVETITQRLPVEVAAGATRLDVNALRIQAPQWERGAWTRLVDPDGAQYAAKDFADALHWYRVTLPQPGTWHLEYVHEPLEPQGVHEVAVRSVVVFG